MGAERPDSMRYLRMLTNSMVGAALGAAYLTVVFLQLNPHAPLELPFLGPLYATLALFYGVHLAVFFYALIVLRQLVATEVQSPGWLSLRLMVWLTAGTAVCASAMMWLNLRGFRAALEADAANRMTLGAAATTAGAVALVAIAFAYGTRRRSGRLAGASLWSLAVAASLALPVVLRGAGVERPLGSRPLALGSTPAIEHAGPRIVMLLLDGASLDYVSPAAAEGRLPNLGKILDAGAAMHLATLRPTQPGPVWTAVASGKYPPKNGVRSAATYEVRHSPLALELLPDLCYAHALVRFGFLQEQPRSAASLRARPLWSILSDEGVSVGIHGWPLTYPATPVRGYVVSDRFAHAARSPLEFLDDGVVYPPGLFGIARAALDLDPRGGSRDVVGVADTATPGPAAAAGIEGEGAVAVGTIGEDADYARAADDLQRRVPTQFVAVRYQGLDRIGHAFLRYALPRSFGDVSDEERRRFGHVLEQSYAYIDRQVGAAMKDLGPADLLLVVSGFGMEPVSLGKRLLARVLGDPDVSGTHEHAPNGFLLAYGSAVAPGRLPIGSIVDVAPTILYFLGLPIGRDMDGYARADLFTRAFTSERPITFIPTYDR